MHERRMFVRALHVAGMPTSEIVDRAIRPQEQEDGSVEPPRFGCSAEAIARLVSELRAEFKREMDVFAPNSRAAALARLYEDVVRLRAELQQMRQPATRRDYGSIRAHAAEIRHQEKLIAEMEGTLKPIKVEHTHGVSDTLVRALAAMTNDQTEEAIREEQQRMRDARSITTTIVESNEKPDQNPGPVPPPVAAQAGRRPALPAPNPSRVLDHPQEVAAPRRERSSDIAARREVRSPLDPALDPGPTKRGITARVAT